MLKHSCLFLESKCILFPLCFRLFMKHAKRVHMCMSFIYLYSVFSMCFSPSVSLCSIQVEIITNHAYFSLNCKICINIIDCYQQIPILKLQHYLNLFVCSTVMESVKLCSSVNIFYLIPLSLQSEGSVNFRCHNHCF